MCWGQRGGEQGCPHPGGAGVQPSDSRASPSTAPSCGKSLPGTYTKVQKQESGDIHIWGRNVFMGYLDDEATTQERVDRHGWMHTGDLGFLDPEDFLYVVGSARGERGAASRALPPAPTAAAGSAAACAPHGAGGLRPSSEEGVPFVCRGSPGGEGQRRAPGAPSFCLGTAPSGLPRPPREPDAAQRPVPRADLITLRSGEKIHPNPIEERLKKYIPIVHYAVLVGQGAPYLCVLLTLKVPWGCAGATRPPGMPAGWGRGCRPGSKMGKLSLGEAQWSVTQCQLQGAYCGGLLVTPERQQVALSLALLAPRRPDSTEQVPPG